ncbi:diiron oxygenase [Streptomyces sp. H27-D2]|uniref:diiron oxygenase n=1 Tax=Streptomyces sp. H27-D2 TaxID=3046304 RepID=UPI002DC0275C|nr:diiron oxygenase [Streptomyces sp. H27-D2]MEC4019435.1 diiron oxygenase [Streptomyces sp. H27-D2]
MDIAPTPGRTEFLELLDRLSQRATDSYYNPFTTFDWPETIPETAYWMSPELMTVHGTELTDALSREQLLALSRWESVNFYSLNVHGIRELLIEVTQRIHTPGFEVPSEFFHHFIGEENDHMWFFATFCRKYGGKVYADKKLKTSEPRDARMANFLVFARILVFEQIVDHYNTHLADDDRLHPTIRHINRLHHQDESRHIAFGRRLVQLLWDEVLRSGISEEERRAAGDYLDRYISGCVASLYNPRAYADAGIPDGFALRQRLLAHPARRAAHAKVLRKTTDFLTGIGVFTRADPALTRHSLLTPSRPPDPPQSPDPVTTS